MSFFDIRMVKRNESATSVKYDAESFDFHPQHEWEAIGIVSIDKEKRQYTFSPGRVWKDHKILPPEFYTYLEQEEERNRRYKAEWGPKGYGYGAYSIKVHLYAVSFMEIRCIP